MRSLLRLALAGILAASAAVVAAPTASAWCQVNLNQHEGFVCTGPAAPQGQPSTCAYYTTWVGQDPLGGYGCVAVGQIGFTPSCVLVNEDWDWICV